VKNPQLSQANTIFENFLGLWIMPILFVLSGAAVFFSLKSRSAGEFRKERFWRIFFPLLTLGLFVFGPLQIYLERLSHGDFQGNFWQFYPHYFDGLYGFGGNFAWMGVHLWYLLLLFLYSLIFLPLFLPSRKTGKSLLSRAAGFFDKPWALFLLFIPLALAVHLTDALGLGVTRGMGGWDIFSYMLFFLYGYLLMANDRIGDILRKYAYVSLFIAIVLAVIMLMLKWIVLSTPDDAYFFKDELRPLTSWFWILAILGLGGRFLNFNSRFLSYANEAVLPFYILHQPVILSIGYFVVQWGWPIAGKYGFITITSFIGIMILYEVLVRRINILRLLFGMRSAGKSKAA
jgi:hypothetical protein